jgi:hypothetical protein
VASRADLADRLLIIILELIQEDKRRTEEDLRAEFEAARPRILGALLDVVSHGLMQLPNIRPNALPRMADFAKWIQACETSIWSAGMHKAAYDASRSDATEVVLEADPVAMALRRHMECRTQYEGTATELLNVLNGLTTEQIKRGKFWPGSANSLSGRLTRLAPNLRQIGITIVKGDRQGHEGARIIRITRGAATPTGSGGSAT